MHLIKYCFPHICLFVVRPTYQYRRGSLFCDSDFLKKRPKTRPEKMRDFLLRFVLVFSEKIEFFEHDEWFKQWVKDCRNGRLRKLLDDFLASCFQFIL